MNVDPARDDGFDKLLQEVDKTLQENKRFLDALKQDNLADDGLDTDDDGKSEPEEEFEEL